MSPLRKIYALKRIRLTGRDAEAAAGFIDEIRLLQRLRSQPNIIQLVDAEVFCTCSVSASYTVHPERLSVKDAGQSSDEKMA